MGCCSSTSDNATAKQRRRLDYVVEDASEEVQKNYPEVPYAFKADQHTLRNAVEFRTVAERQQNPLALFLLNTFRQFELDYDADNGHLFNVSQPISTSLSTAEIQKTMDLFASWLHVVAKEKLPFAPVLNVKATPKKSSCVTVNVHLWLQNPSLDDVTVACDVREAGWVVDCQEAEHEAGFLEFAEMVNGKTNPVAVAMYESVSKFDRERRFLGYSLTTEQTTSLDSEAVVTVEMVEAACKAFAAFLKKQLPSYTVVRCDQSKESVTLRLQTDNDVSLRLTIVYKLASEEVVEAQKQAQKAQAKAAKLERERLVAAELEKEDLNAAERFAILRNSNPLAMMLDELWDGFHAQRQKQTMLPGGPGGILLTEDRKQLRHTQTVVVSSIKNPTFELAAEAKEHIAAYLLHSMERGSMFWKTLPWGQEPEVDHDFNLSTGEGIVTVSFSLNDGDAFNQKAKLSVVFVDDTVCDLV